MRSNNSGPETSKACDRRSKEGFYKYLEGTGLDIGYKGSVKDADPIVNNAIGIDTDYPGYDGVHLPFASETRDFVYNSHCLEHIKDWKEAIREWMRVVKIGGYLIITVPHMYLYEKKASLPSRWNGDHKRFYTPGSLMIEVENALSPNSYRVVYLKDCDEGFDYNIGPTNHSCGEYQIELVLKKIKCPNWEIE